jgi:hypothetical protein
MLGSVGFLFAQVRSYYNRFTINTVYVSLVLDWSGYVWLYRVTSCYVRLYVVRSG